MPTLQEHQLRVAAVAKKICDSIPNAVHTDSVIAACLLHDMGNIIKFDLSYFPQFLEPEGFEYWQSVKDDYIAKYGPEEHAATEAICREIGLSETIMSCVVSTGFSKVKRVLDNDSIEKKICCYADQRVGPHGVLSIDERLIDGRKRYANTKRSTLNSEQFESIATALKELEAQIFSKSTITPELITNDSIKNIISELKNFEVAS